MNNAILAPQPASQAARSAPYAAVMAECGRILRRHANAAMASVCETLPVEIDTLCRETYDASESDKYGELRRVLLQSGDALPRAFASALEGLMSRPVSPRRDESQRNYRAQRFADVVLSLVDDMVFSETLLIGTQARQLHNACENELRDLLPRIAVLLGIEGEIEDGRNPLAPEVVAEALKEACWSLECSLQARQALLGLVTVRIARALPDAYRAINTHLVDRKVLPRVRPSVRRGGRPEQSRAQRTPEAAGMLRRLVGQEAASVGAGMQHEAANDAIMDALSRLQAGQGSFQLGGQQFSVDAAAADSVNVVRVLLDAGLSRQVGTLDGIIIDIVATLFDFIFDDDRVPTPMKALIGRMQLPVLKLALSDHAFFSDRQHPARRLINTLAQAASTWDGEFTDDSSLYLIAEPLVQRIQDSGGNDVAAFSSGLAALDAFLAEQERLADERAVTLTDKLTEREVAEIARSVAIGTVARYLSDESVPQVIRALLDPHWTAVLADAAREGGENGDRWVDAVATMDDLVWSVQPKTSADERQRLVRLLPGLIARLKQGLEACGMAEAERSAFFSELVKLHANAVKNGMQPVVKSAGQPVAEGMHDDFPPDDGLDELKRGDWVELLLEAGHRRAVRLTWISPARTMFLFANRQGVRAVALTRSELARKFERNEALLIDDEPLMDRLVANVLDDYQPLAEGNSP
ncbi:MAG: DUF1631 domain-containing protein [Pseudazoarcus pumilus]|nr:DUF1631 domain-containing protein [Pseudazoarcus pumilus]